MTTLERIKYLESITEREKVLREEIDVQKSTLENIKFRLSHSETRPANRIYKKRIKYQKFVICALKHELERITRVCMKYVHYGLMGTTWQCSRCHEQFVNGSDHHLPERCPNCNRRIKEWRT